MTRLLFSLILYVPVIGVAQSGDSALVGQLNQKWIASYASHDTGIMQQMLADDFIMIAPKGNRLNRMDIIRNVGAADVTTIATIDSA